MTLGDDDGGGDFISIRGTRLPLRTLVDPRIGDRDYVDGLRRALEQAAPFPHLSLQGLFDPQLLACVRDEFDHFSTDGWRGFRNRYEQTFRSSPHAALGPASRLYFSLVHSEEFVRFLSRLTGIDDLITDAGLFGGGLHESRNGGRFGIHRDFDRHPQTGLRNRMVLLTYLNPSWQSEWGGELELWDPQRQACVTRITPLLGTSLLMLHGRDSFHGHPGPLQMPADTLRRSLACYYYSADPVADAGQTTTTSFLQPALAYSFAWATVRQARRWTPPALWEVARRVRRYWNRRLS
jgi:hypothetical protein